MGLAGKFQRAIRTGTFALGLIGAVTFGSSAIAGVLDGHASAFNDGNGPSAGAWTTTTAFDNGSGVSGTVDWAVYGPGDFPFAGYSPTAGELTYAFQIYSTGASAIHSLTINGINSSANNIGSFADLAGEATVSTALGTQAEWNFDGLDAGENSNGLAFSSIRTPENNYGVAINGGSFSIVVPLPVPGDNDIPEPASLALLGAGSLMMLRRRG